VVAWQDYLIAEETGNLQASRTKLDYISSQLASTPILPRSMVLRLLNPQDLKPATVKTGDTRQVPFSVATTALAFALAQAAGWLYPGAWRPRSAKFSVAKKIECGWSVPIFGTMTKANP